ncbi:porin [Rhizobium sp. Rhizsp82]|uniref:porin n=1 Tax=Rhizobium sp. Rhizsp82 TaxID=3243057 RepID=UPI0039B55E03
MNIKSLLLGSAAALAVVSGAQAADAIVAAEPEAVEYVKVCDAYGTGYFYIPGTETCLKIGGYVRFDVGFGAGDGYDNNGGEDWETHTRAHVSFDAKSDTEYGPLTSRIVLEANRYAGGPNLTNDADFPGAANAAYGGSDGMNIDEAYIDFAGFRVGRFASWWDNDFSGESDIMGNVTKTNSIRYQYDSGSFYAGLALEDVGAYDGRGFAVNDNNGLGIDGSIGGQVGGFTWAVYGGYDASVQEGAVTARIGADIGPGKFELAGIYSSDPSAYYNAGEWAIAAQYALKATDKLTVTPEVQYTDKIDLDSTGSYDNGNMWRAGVTLNYQIVENLSTELTATYVKEDHDGRSDDDYVEGFFRLQRDF